MLKTFQKLSLLLLVVGTFFMGSIVLPASHVAYAADTCAELKKKLKGGGFDVDSQLPVYCSTESVYNKFITLALYFVGIAAVIMIIYGGYTYMTAGGDAAQAKKGRAILTWALAGLAVVILAAVIVNAVVKAIVEK
jgi:hypothetical protein